MMIPQGFRLEIQTEDTDEPVRYVVVGWRDYGETFRPVVVDRNKTNGRAVTLPDGVSWKVIS